MTRVTDDAALWLAKNVLPHEPALRSWLKSRRLAGLEIDDVIQETYARLIARQPLDGIQNPRSYAFSTAYSVVLTHVRRARVVSFQAVADLDELGAVAQAPSPETEVVARDELLQLAKAIATLPPRVGEVFRLRRVEGLSQRQVAERLGVSEGTIEKHIGKAIFLLMERFGRGGSRRPRASKDLTEVKQTENGQRVRPRD